MNTEAGQAARRAASMHSFMKFMEQHGDGGSRAWMSPRIRPNQCNRYLKNLKVHHAGYRACLTPALFSVLPPSSLCLPASISFSLSSFALSLQVPPIPRGQFRAMRMCEHAWCGLTVARVPWGRGETGERERDTVA
eukprot:15478268-Alexandrium_andersonii.AAC.2